MPSTISTSDIRNVHIYSRNSRELGLCRKHRQELCQSIADELNALVTSQLFQNQFKDFFPASNTHEEIHISIRIANDQITVQEIEQDGKTLGCMQHIRLKNNENFEDEEIGEAKEINKGILEKANQIYRNHLRESDRLRGGRSDSPLRSRTAHFEPRRNRVSEEHLRRSHRREHYPSPVSEKRRRRQHWSRNQQTRRHHTSVGPNASDSRTRPVGQKGNHAEPSSDQNKHGKLPNQISRSAPNRQLRQSPSLVKSRIESTASTHDEQLQVLQRKNADLEQRLAQVSPENASLTARLPESKSSILPAEYNELIHLSQNLASTQLSGSLDFPADLKDQFLKMPKNIRDAIYYQTYLLVDPSEAHNPWPIGQRLFEDNAYSDNTPNLCRAHAIRHYIMHMLASDFAHIEGKKPPEELLRRFSQLPEEDRAAVFTQLTFIQPKGPDYEGAAHAFAGEDRLSVTNQERSIAIQRVTLDRIAEYHRHHYRQQMEQVETVFKRFQEDALTVQRQLEELQKTSS